MHLIQIENESSDFALLKSEIVLTENRCSDSVPSLNEKSNSGNDLCVGPTGQRVPAYCRYGIPDLTRTIGKALRPTTRFLDRKSIAPCHQRIGAVEKTNLDLDSIPRPTYGTSSESPVLTSQTTATVALPRPKKKPRLVERHPASRSKAGGIDPPVEWNDFGIGMHFLKLQDSLDLNFSQMLFVCEKTNACTLKVF